MLSVFSYFSLSETQKVNLLIQSFSIYTGTTGAAHNVHNRAGRVHHMHPRRVQNSPETLERYNFTFLNVLNYSRRRR